MIPFFGTHDRTYRRIPAMNRLRELPAGTTLSLRSAARLLGTDEAGVQQLVGCYAAQESLDRQHIDATTLAMRSTLPMRHA